MTRMLVVTTVRCTLTSFLMPYAAHFRARGWTVDALASGATLDPACLEGFDHCFEADWSRNPLRPQGLVRMPGVLRRRVAAGAYDLVHVHTPVAAFITRYALRDLPREQRPAVVYTAHGFHFHDRGNPLANAAFAALERLAGPWTDRLVVINRSDEQEALRRRIVEPARLRHMPGIGLDLARYHPGSVRDEAVASVRAELGLAPGQPLFLMVAGFQPGKRHRDLLAAFEALGETRAHLAFAGEGPLLRGLQAWCRKRALAARVHFLGQRPDVPALMRASLATVLPSEREGLPRSVMESMALGVPVIGADARGLRDLLAQCGGELVPVGHPAALRAAMQRLIQDPARARDLGEQARSRMAPFDIAHLLQMHEELYAELLEARRG
jgi:glycosyltransferase involved in cell wall biosynthesis